ncbi:chemotaxis protein CheA [Oryzibacter oryziterrae]|uniref:chemotaxis protein CheA n=1 Tax=Oryzibacter oryziterrae TaxID=2766474 RepID=UPI001F1E0CFD|nr:chemotaxis protein CheA [Oryzibacter oryziterrae]
MSNLDPSEIFRIEAAELLEQIEQGLLDLEHRLDDRSLIDAVFRALHTLKGSGAMFGFDALAAFTHHCETAFDRVRKGLAPATPELVAAVLAARDHMRALVEDQFGEDPEEERILLDQLQRAVTGGAASQEPAAVAVAPVAIQAAPTAPADATTWRLKIVLPENAMINGTNPLTLLDELRELGDCQVKADRSRIPPLEHLVPTELYLSWDVILKTTHSRAEIEDVFIFVMDEMTLEMEEVTGAVAPVADASQASNVTVLPVPQAPVAVAETVPERAVPEIVPSQADVARQEAAADTRLRRKTESVRVPAERLDELMDRVGELVIAQSRLSQIAAGSMDVQLRTVSEEMERLCSELRITMMVLRMVPVATLFDRYRRLVHDLQRDTGKHIELMTDGESTEMDKTVIERLADPLVHLVRNAADHGLEPEADRVAAGKPGTGRITLSARQVGGEVIVTVSDDGRGINRDRVRAKAEAVGLIQPGQELSDSELLQLIFQPGFSTAAQVTNLSGRGVGMDVVKKTIESLHGTIDVSSKLGEGSTVSLRIPLTLAIIDGLLVRVGQGCYVIPLPAVEECLELSLEEDFRSRGRSFLSLRGSLVPFIRLRELFATGTQPDPFQKVVVVSTGNERVGLVVDQIIGDHQTVIKSMSKLHDDVTTFTGATILGDGSVALILDVANLVAVGQQQEAQLRAIA